MVTNRQWHYAKLYPLDGSKMIQFNANETTDGAKARLRLPSIDLSNMNYPRLSFMMYHEDSNSSITSEGITVQLSVNGTDWTDLKFYPRYIMTTGWQTYRIDLTYYTGQTVYIGFVGHSGNGSNIYLDRIETNYAGPTSGMTMETLISYAGASISFTDDSFQASTYSWDFGDTSTSTTQNVSHIYANPGIYTIVHSINSSASSTTQTIQILPVITPSYLPEHGGDFESNYFHFGTQLLDGNINLWELGEPGNTIANTASGLNVWKTDLDSNIIENYQICALYTPEFDLSATGAYLVKFKYRMEVYFGNCPGAAWMEYSTDQGKTWQRLGAKTGNPDGTQNWYNTENNSIAPDGICWWHDRTEYTQAIYNLSNFMGEPHMAFRWIYQVEPGWSAAGYNIDGFAVDDFSLEYEAPTAGFTMDRECSYVGKNITFTDTSTFPTDWSWDFGDSTTSISQNPTHAYTSPGNYTITLSINNSASQVSQCITILPVMTPSYLPADGGDFESNPQHFFSNIIDGEINLWERGIPSNTISDTASGLNVWKTDLDSNIQQANYTCVLNTPAFDLSLTGNYYVKFQYRMEIYYGNCPGSAWLEYSIDKGDTWQRLGADTGNPEGTQNWYNKNDHDIAPDGICWWHTKSSYTQAIYNLIDFLGETSICFRFVYKVAGNWSAEGYNIDGFAIDDFTLEYVPPTADFQITSDVYYAGVPIQFIDQSTFPDNWAWDFQGMTSTSQNVTHTFASPGDYTVSLSINNNASMASKVIRVLPTIKPSYTTLDGGDFESNALHFSPAVISGTINLWEHGTPSNIISDTASGANVWKTDLDANIQKADYTCVLYTPNFDFSRSGEYYLKFKYRMHITAGNCPGAGWMDYSTDCGNTWQKLGAYTDNPDGTQEWYNQYEHDIAPDGVCWWGIKSTYSQVIYNLSEYAGNSNISFRFVLMVQGNWSGGYDSDGWSIDDFEIEHQTNAPTILPLIQDQTINEDSSFTPITLDNHVSDTNHLASEITWSTSVSDHLSVNIDTSRIATISINAPDWYGVESIIFTATDPEGMTDTDLVVFTVISVNDPPTIANAIPDQTADQDVPFSFTFGSNIFEDVDAGDNLTYTATLNDGNPLPSWLTFNSFTRTFNGTPTNNDGGTITIIVTAEDSFSESVSDAFDLTVSNATSKYWVISDSPASYASNTWTENNWTEINVSNDQIIINWSIAYVWSADNYPEEASFLVLSPSGTQYIIASGETSGTYTITTNSFNGELANGQWRLWIEDSNSDGGCQALTLTMSIETTDSLPQLSVISNVNTLENLSTSLFFSLTDTFDGIISLTPYSSDNNLVCSDNILLTHVSMMHESETYTLSVTAGIPETITLTMIPSNNLYGKTQIDVILSNAYNLTALTSFTLTIVESAARSVELDGIDDHIITNSDMTIAPTNAISIESWIYLYTNTTDLAILSCGNDSHQSITFEHGLHNLDMRLRNAGNIDMIVVHDVSASPLPLNQWHHVCAVWDNTTNIGKLYVNGICVYYATFVSDTIGYSNARKLYMGSCFGLQKFFKGRLDEVRFWRTALQEQTIREWRFKTLTNEHPDFDQLIAYYPFSAVDGTLVFDLIGNHHGYLYNNTTAAVGPTRQVWIPFNSWLNSNNNDWNNPINWEAEFVPNKTNPGYVFINAGMRKPVLSAPSSINNLVLDKGASYQASNVNSLNIFGKFYNQMNTVNIDIGSSLTVFSSMDFKTDRIAPVLENKSLSITTNASEFNIQWEQATDDQTSLLNLEYAVIMSSYSQTCLESLGLIAANITPCEIETLIPFQTVSGSGNGETVRSIAGNFAEVNISGLSGGTYYFNVLVRDEMNNMAVYDAQN
jgi:PKD repeat protein